MIKYLKKLIKRLRGPKFKVGDTVEFTLYGKEYNGIVSELISINYVICEFFAFGIPQKHSFDPDKLKKITMTSLQKEELLLTLMGYREYE